MNWPEAVAFVVAILLFVTPLPEVIWEWATKHRREREYREYRERLERVSEQSPD